MKVTYPAVIHEEQGAYWVSFPDLEGCFSDGSTLTEAAENAVDALGGYLCALMDAGEHVPEPSPLEKVCADGAPVVLIVSDPLRYKKNTRAVKKTLTIPEWLNAEAEKRHVNFSATLQQALLNLIQ